MAQHTASVRLLGRVSLIALLLSTIAACGGGGGSGEEEPDATGDAGLAESVVVSAAGAVAAPPGMDPGTLRVLGVEGAVEVDGSGAFDATLFDDSVPGLLLVVDADENLVAMGFARPGESTSIDARSTALALLFIAAGGVTLPAPLTEPYLAALDETSATSELATAVAAAQEDDPLAVTNGGDALLAALTDATESLPMSGEAQPLVRIAEQAMDFQDVPTNILLQPSADTPQSGIRLVHGADSGVAAQNEYRRLARLAVYQTAVEDEDGNRQERDPPTRVGDLLEIPATGRLDLLSVGRDIVSFEAPFSPELSASVDLPLAEGAEKTFYDLIVLGPSLDFDDVPALFTDSRYFGETDGWESAINDMAWEMFFVDYFIPVATTLLLSNGARIQRGRVRDAMNRFRSAADPVLARNGIFIPLVAGGSTIRFLMQELAAGNAIINTAMLEAVGSIFARDAARTAAFEAQVGRLRSAARAATVLAAIEGLMTVGDISVVTTHLGRSRRAERWEATVIGARVRVEPSEADVTRNDPSVQLTASVDGAPDGTFVYRWHSTGNYGDIHTLLDGGGNRVVTDENEVQYIANFLSIPDDGRYLDTVSVEVYTIEDEFVGSGAAEVHSGDDIPIGQSCQVTLTTYDAPAGWTFGDENPNDVTCEMDVEGTWVIDPESLAGCVESAPCRGECERTEFSSIGYPIQWQTYDEDGEFTGGNHCGAPGGVRYGSCGAPILWTQTACSENFCESLRDDTQSFECAACNCACGGGNCYPWTGPGSITFSAFANRPCSERCEASGPNAIRGSLSFRIVNCAAVDNRLPNCPGNDPTE